jgi:hypothetical protein
MKGHDIKLFIKINSWEKLNNKQETEDEGLHIKPINQR